MKYILFVLLFGCVEPGFIVSDECTTRDVEIIQRALDTANHQLHDGDDVLFIHDFGKAETKANDNRDTISCRDDGATGYLGFCKGSDITLYRNNLEKDKKYKATVLHELGHYSSSNYGHCGDCSVMRAYPGVYSEFSESDLAFLED